MDVQGTVTFFKNYATFGAGAYLAGKSLVGAGCGWSTAALTRLL